MTETTPNLALPEIAAAQAQKHVTHNEALRALDAIVHLAVLDRDLVSPPETPAEGQRWLVGAPAADDWTGHDDEIAAWQDGGWHFYPPHVGWLAYVMDEAALVAWSGSAWEPALDLLSGATELQNMALLGVGTTADETNPFSAKLNNALWVARTEAEGGDGDLRYKLSKESEGKTLSLLFQDDFSGRAEIGLTGDDDFHFKVSDDGTTWREAIVIDKGTGQVSFPQGGASSDLELTVAELALGVADALNVAQFLGDAGNRFADSFDALTYVDTGAATNLNTGTAGLLKPTSTSESLISPSGLTSLTDFGTSPSIAFDGTTATGAGASAIRSTSSSAYIGKTLSASKRISKGRYHPSTDSGIAGGNISNLVIQLRAKTGSAPSNFASDGVLLGTTGTMADTTSVVEIVNTGDTATAFDHWWFSLARVGGSDDNWVCAEAQAYTPGTCNNMTVASVALTAAMAPSSAKLVAQAKEIDSVTLNTDLICSVSRDGGTTWSAFAMTNKFTANAVGIYESATLDISGQPSGTSVKWKITTANNKAIEIHGIYLGWS